MFAVCVRGENPIVVAPSDLYSFEQWEQKEKGRNQNRKRGPAITNFSIRTSTGLISCLRSAMYSFVPSHITTQFFTRILVISVPVTISTDHTLKTLWWRWCFTVHRCRLPCRSRRCPSCSWKAWSRAGSASPRWTCITQEGKISWSLRYSSAHLFIIYCYGCRYYPHADELKWIHGTRKVTRPVSY